MSDPILDRMDAMARKRAAPQAARHHVVRQRHLILKAATAYAEVKQKGPSAWVLALKAARWPTRAIEAAIQARLQRHGYG